MITISLKIPEDLNVRIRNLAEKRKSSASAVARKALEQYLSAQPESSRASVLDVARDLAGSVEGPRDLSSSKRHMKGYGR
jgi:Arc/MetJ-type ribon-helix-helix transcriptional regulator